MLSPRGANSACTRCSNTQAAMRPQPWSARPLQPVGISRMQPGMRCVGQLHCLPSEHQADADDLAFQMQQLDGDSYGSGTAADSSSDTMQVQPPVASTPTAGFSPGPAAIQYAENPRRRRYGTAAPLQRFTAVASAPLQQQASPASPSGPSIQRPCYRCGSPGHWASQCPQQALVQVPLSEGAGVSSSSTSSASGRGGGASRSYDTCYKCGQPGHWANQCTAAPSRATSTPRKPCPRCGNMGHWARDCPTQPSRAFASDDPFMAEPEPEQVADEVTLSALFPTTQLLLPSREPGVLRHHLTGDQRSPEWLEARSKRLTASSLVKALGVSPAKSVKSGARPRQELFYEKLGITEVKVNKAMEHGQETEPIAKLAYCEMSGQLVVSCDFVSYQTVSTASQQVSSPDDAWLGASPDGLIIANAEVAQVLLQSPHQAGTVVPSELLHNAGILEIKAPFGGYGRYGNQPVRVEDAVKNSKYLFQLQGVMEMLDLDWGDLFVYSKWDKQYLQVRVYRDRALWADMLPHLHSFWWDHIVPARKALEAHLAAGGADDQDSKKAVVARYLPGELPRNATGKLEEQVLDMYERADKVSSC